MLANRFGIVLAALNVCYFVSKNFISYAFSHGNGSGCYFVKQYVFQWMRFQCVDIMLYTNSPALVISAMLGKLMQGVSPQLCSFTYAKIQIVFFIILVTLQWLFIGQTAKTIARAIRPTK